MATQIRVIEYNGRARSVGQWSNETGLSHSTITNRLELGWSPEKILETAPAPSAKNNGCRVTKNQAELELNDTPYEKLPKCLTDLIPRKKLVFKVGRRAEPKYGELFKEKHKAEFQKWFTETHCS